MFHTLKTLSYTKIVRNYTDLRDLTGYNEMENKLQSRKTIGATGIKRGKHRMARVQRAMSKTSLTGTCGSQMR